MRFTLLGAAIAVLGAVALYFGGIPYTEREQVVDIGPFEASAEMREQIDIPPLLSGGVLALGVGIAVYGMARDR